ncbi:MAG: 16S rRNA (guanine(966)-N(2))-methyltransferase RsmD [Clostridiales bacterium 38-18]|nr:MAG: 16S rRNA (guanine(966)-N(2))-methyltransferase RsmD [Clostridiales bacterium 38-18]
MRVISGSARGIALEALDGLDTRPTTDRVKEAVFSMLQPYIYGSVCLDLFSGSGALGIELLSRGASRVYMVEQSKSAMSIIERNLNKTKLTTNAVTVTSEVYGFLEKESSPKYQIIMMDPPYNKGHVCRSLEKIAENNLLLENGLVVVEHAIGDADLSIEYNNLEVIKEKKYGKIGITVFRRL